MDLVVTSEDESLRLQSDRARAGFAAEGATPDIELRAAMADLALPLGGRPVFDSGGAWKLYRSGDRYLFAFWSAALGPDPYKLLCLSPDFSAGRLLFHRPYLAAEQPLYPLEYPLDELLVSLFLAARGWGVEVHACGAVDRQGDGHLLVGASGAGKSTMARRWSRVAGPRILSDDRVIVRPEKTGFCLFGTPWHGELDCCDTGAAPLRAIYFLRKGRRNRLARLRPAEAVSRLFVCSFLPLYSRSALETGLGFLERLCRSVPCYRMEVGLDRDADDLVRGIAR
jgi:hypothetical protein